MTERTIKGTTMLDVLIGTSNPGKRGEFAELLTGLPLRLLTLGDVGLADMNVEEDGGTLEANSLLKVRAYSAASGKLTLADDTGLYVDALGGEPGIYPARYGGSGLTMPQRRQKLLTALTDTPDALRTARFVCVIALAGPPLPEPLTVRGVCEGRIGTQEDSTGRTGFGYDPLFIPQGYAEAFASLSAEEKNRISHRGLAAAQMRAVLQKLVSS
jgi:XTP/dITP diphosphohydrolase